MYILSSSRVLLGPSFSLIISQSNLLVLLLILATTKRFSSSVILFAISALYIARSSAIISSRLLAFKGAIIVKGYFLGKMVEIR